MCLDEVFTRALNEVNGALKRRFITGLKNNSSICKLELEECDVSESGPGYDILNAFKERKSKLTKLFLRRCREVGDGGAVVSLLRNCMNLKMLKLVACGVDNTMLAKVVAAIRGKRELEQMCLNMNSIEGLAGCKVLADLLQDPQCNLITLELDGNQIDNDGLLAIVAALSRNSKLQTLLMLGLIREGVAREIFYDAFSQVICDTSSVNATFLSNHTLTDVRIDGDINPFSFYLRLNDDPDKYQVAIKKIIRHHSYIDMEPFFQWDLKVLPNAVHWFGRALACSQNYQMSSIETRKLSAIYQFARAMPLLVVPAPTIRPRRSKRKKLS